MHVKVELTQWQNGYAADCNSEDPGSTPGWVSKYMPWRCKWNSVPPLEGGFCGFESYPGYHFCPLKTSCGGVLYASAGDEAEEADTVRLSVVTLR